MRTIHLTHKRPDAEVEALAGTFLDASSYDHLLREDTTVYKPDGSLLCVLRCGVLAPAECYAAFQALRVLPIQARHGNRGLAGGKPPLDATVIPALAGIKDGRPIGRRSAIRMNPLKQDGTVSNTHYGVKVPSGIAGYFERQARFPYCRQTAFLLQYPQKFRAALPCLQAISQVFAATVPERYAAQHAQIQQTHPDFYIHNTVFTTITVNRNWRTAVHQDAGDLRAGFGVMTAFRAGQFDGCYFVWPTYRVAVDMHTTDVLFGDVHEWHGNTAFTLRGPYERISLVCYYREKMRQCGSAQDELHRAQNRRRGQPLFDKGAPL